MRFQPLVRARLASLGEEGARWAEDLPDLLHDLAARWGLTLRRALPGGSAAHVVAATTDDGHPRVLKVGLPGADLLDEARTLRAADGRGYVRLYDADHVHRALLLEELGTSLDREPLTPQKALTTLAQTLKQAWTLPLTTAPAVRRGEDKASTLHELVRGLDAQHPGSCEPRVRDQALAYAEELASDEREDWVVVHGDAQPANLLRTKHRSQEGFVFVDPDGFRADPAYDCGVAVRDWSRRLDDAEDPRGLLRTYCVLLADETGLDPDRIWRWGYLERVSTGLYVTDFGGTAIGRRFLDSAALLLDT